MSSVNRTLTQRKLNVTDSMDRCESRDRAVASGQVQQHEPQALIQGFLETRYRVQLEPALVVLVGQSSAMLDSLAGSAGWAILTAWNPDATPQGADRNRRANQALLDDLLINRTGPVIKTIHLAQQDSEQPTWPEEQGWFFAIDHVNQVHGLAQRYGQLGSLIGQPGQAIELWLYGKRWPASLPAHVRRWSS